MPDPTPSVSSSPCVLRDVNGDGLMDRVITNPATRRVEISFATAKGSLPFVHQITRNNLRTFRGLTLFGHPLQSLLGTRAWQRRLPAELMQMISGDRAASEVAIDTTYITGISFYLAPASTSPLRENPYDPCPISIKFEGNLVIAMAAKDVTLPLPKTPPAGKRPAPPARPVLPEKIVLEETPAKPFISDNPY